MKKYSILLAMLFLMSCHNENNSATKKSDLSSGNQDNLFHSNEDSVPKQVAVFNEFNSTLIEIQKDLNDIVMKEKMLNLSTQDPELRRTKKDQIISDIRLIYSRMIQNKQNLTVLNKKLNDANSRIDSLKGTIADLDFQLNNKKKEFKELNAYLTKISPDYVDLLSIYKEDKQEVDLKTEALNTGYYSIGTFKDLEKRGIITKEGGFIGIGQRIELNKNFNSKNFTKINIMVLTEISLNKANKVTLVTPHPSDSYKFIQDPFYSKLIILDPLGFWSSSKFLVLVTER